MKPRGMSGGKAYAMSATMLRRMVHAARPETHAHHTKEVRDALVAWGMEQLFSAIEDHCEMLDSIAESRAAISAINAENASKRGEKSDRKATAKRPQSGRKATDDINKEGSKEVKKEVNKEVINELSDAEQCSQLVTNSADISPGIALQEAHESGEVGRILSAWCDACVSSGRKAPQKNRLVIRDAEALVVDGYTSEQLAPAFIRYLRAKVKDGHSLNHFRFDPERYLNNNTGAVPASVDYAPPVRRG